MKKVLVYAISLLFVLSMASLAAAKDKSYYVCGCGPECKCDSVSNKPGKCKCGKQRVKMHLLSIEGSTATFCTCGGDCKCKQNSADPAKCGCGKPVRKVSIKGMYICGCGPDCKCNSISDKPGKCGCNKPMKLVE